MTERKAEALAPVPYKSALDSCAVGWQALSVSLKEILVERFSDGPADRPVSPDPAIILHRGTGVTIERLSGGRWEKTRYTRGQGCLYPSNFATKLRFDFDGEKPAPTLHLVLPHETVAHVSEEMKRPGARIAPALTFLPLLDDPTLARFGFGVLAALRMGAPNFYAQTAAQWISAHLLLGPEKSLNWQQTLFREKVTDARLIRVLEYIEANIAERLDLRALAREAGLSPYHFAALFTRSVGSTPHRHVHSLRIEIAMSMLRSTDKTMTDIALTCGFASSAHLASKFRGAVGSTPTAYRRQFKEQSGF